MQRNAKLVITGLVALGAVGAAAGVGVAETGDDQPLEGATYDQAVAAATAEVDGEVVETELGDDGASYEVEIRTSAGNVVEVELDDSFAVIGTENDDDDQDDDDGSDDD